MNNYQIYKELKNLFEDIQNCNFIKNINNYTKDDTKNSKKHSTTLKSNVEKLQNDQDHFIYLLNKSNDIAKKDIIFYEFIIYLYKNNTKNFIKFICNHKIQLYPLLLWLEPIEIIKFFNINNYITDKNKNTGGLYPTTSNKLYLILDNSFNYKFVDKLPKYINHRKKKIIPVINRLNILYNTILSTDLIIHNNYSDKEINNLQDLLNKSHPMNNNELYIKNIFINLFNLNKKLFNKIILKNNLSSLVLWGDVFYIVNKFQLYKKIFIKLNNNVFYLNKFIIKNNMGNTEGSSETSMRLGECLALHGTTKGCPPPTTHGTKSHPYIHKTTNISNQNNNKKHNIILNNNIKYSNINTSEKWVNVINKKTPIKPSKKSNILQNNKDNKDTIDNFKKLKPLKFLSNNINWSDIEVINKNNKDEVKNTKYNQKTLGTSNISEHSNNIPSKLNIGESNDRELNTQPDTTLSSIPQTLTRPQLIKNIEDTWNNIDIHELNYII